jgi:GxxExxY protein
MREMKITEMVIGCAFEVYNTLGFGFLESVNEKSMYYELYNKGLNIKRQQPVANSRNATCKLS